MKLYSEAVLLSCTKELFITNGCLRFRWKHPPEAFYKDGVLKDFTKINRKTPVP